MDGKKQKLTTATAGVIMEYILFNTNSYASVRYFDSYEQCARDTIPYSTSGTVALSGGSTYEHLFDAWRDLSPDLSGASFFPVDERAVPFDDPQSNWGLACRQFLVPLGKDSDREHFSASLEEYTAILARQFPTGVIIFDTIFLGVGEDGHTASLFPDQTYLNDHDSILLQTKSPVPPVDRITLAPKVLLAAEKVITVITGANKKRIVQEILQLNENLPIVKILSQRAESELYIDKKLIS